MRPAKTMRFPTSSPSRLNDAVGQASNPPKSWFRHLLRPQTFYRVCPCCFHGLEADGGKCNNDSGKPACGKYPPTYADAVNIILQPLVHVIPGNRCGNNKSDGNKHNK